MVKVTIPITAVEKGKEYTVPVNISGIPKDVTGFDLVVTTDKSLAELDAIEKSGTLCADGMVAAHNSETVYNQQKEGGALGSAGISLGWKSPYNRGCMLISGAMTYGTTGKVLIKLKVWASGTGNAVFNAVYLNYGVKDYKKGTTTVFGKIPLILKFVDGVWTPYEG